MIWEKSLGTGYCLFKSKRATFYIITGSKVNYMYKSKVLVGMQKVEDDINDII